MPLLNLARAAKHTAAGLTGYLPQPGRQAVVHRFQQDLRCEDSTCRTAKAHQSLLRNTVDWTMAIVTSGATSAMTATVISSTPSWL